MARKYTLQRGRAKSEGEHGGPLTQSKDSSEMVTQKQYFCNNTALLGFLIADGKPIHAT